MPKITVHGGAEAPPVVADPVASSAVADAHADAEATTPDDSAAEVLAVMLGGGADGQ